MMFKFPLLSAALLAMFAPTSNAAVFMTLSGQATSAAATKSDGSTLTPVGTTYFLLVDTGSAGFSAATTHTIPDGTLASLGSIVAGDTMVYEGLTSTLGRINNQQAAGNTLSSVDLQAHVGKQFALMWMDAGDPGAAFEDGDLYGFVTNSTWIIPAVSGTWTFTTAAPGANQFSQATAPGSATLVVGVPEPSRALLAALGVSGLVLGRRRRPSPL